MDNKKLWTETFSVYF